MTIETKQMTNADIARKLKQFSHLMLGTQAQELDDFAATISAARGSAGGLLLGQTREQTDLLLVGMTKIVNAQLPSPVNPQDNPNVMAQDVADKAKAVAAARAKAAKARVNG